MRECEVVLTFPFLVKDVLRRYAPSLAVSVPFTALTITFAYFPHLSGGCLFLTSRDVILEYRFNVIIHHFLSLLQTSTH